MRLVFWSRPVTTEEAHRITYVEIFFDPVFIFAYTRVTALMGRPPPPTTMVRGLILLLLLWMSWTTFTRADAAHGTGMPDCRQAPSNASSCTGGQYPLS